MRIALLVSGEYREFPVAHKLWAFLTWPNVDVYFATWDKTLHINQNRNTPPILKNVTEQDILQYITPTSYKIIEYTSCQFNTDKMYSCGAMIFLWKTVIQMLEDSGVNYDVVVMVRPDLGLQFDEKILSDFFQTKLQKSDDILYAINSLPLGQMQLLSETENLSDLMYVGGQNTIIKLKNIPLEEFYSLQPPNIIDTHKFLAKHCGILYKWIHNLPIEDWCIVRSNSHLKFDKSFDEYKKDSQIWWETYYNNIFVGTHKNLSKESIDTWMKLELTQ